MKALYTAIGSATGGRGGKASTSDGAIDLALAVPKEMGGPGGNGTNPEQLFAMGYSACFGGAIGAVARKSKTEIGETKVTAHVTFGTEDDGAYSLAVALHVSIGGVDHATAEKLVEEAHQVCPYSRATRGNIPVSLIVE